MKKKIGIPLVQYTQREEVLNKCRLSITSHFFFYCNKILNINSRRCRVSYNFYYFLYFLSEIHNFFFFWHVDISIPKSLSLNQYKYCVGKYLFIVVDIVNL